MKPRSEDIHSLLSGMLSLCWWCCFPIFMGSAAPERSVYCESVAVNERERNAKREVGCGEIENVKWRGQNQYVKEDMCVGLTTACTRLFSLPPGLFEK